MPSPYADAMSPTRSRVLAPLLVTVLLAGGLLAGCSLTSDDEPTSKASTSATPEPSDSESASPTESASPSESASATASGTPSPTLTPDAALLTAAEMPPLNDSSPWRLRDTGPISSRPFGLCQKFDVLSVGAEQAVQRRFTAVGGGSAAQQIATFPDTATAARATKVLQAWHRTCAARVPGTSVKVRPIALGPGVPGPGLRGTS